MTRSTTQHLAALLAFGAAVALCSTAWAQDEPLFDDEPSLEPIVPGGELPKDDTVEPPRGEKPTTVSQDMGPLANVNAGVTFRQRSFTVDSVDANLDFSSSLYPTVYVGGEVFPLTGDGILGNFGLVGAFARGLDTTSINEGGVLRKVPTRHQEISLAVAYRHQLAEGLKIQADTGVLFLDFVLSDNPFYSSTTYRAWTVSATSVYTATPWLDVLGGLHLFPFVGLGDSEAEFGQDSSTFGASAHLALEASVIAGLYVHGGYELRAFSSSFTGAGDRGLESATTTDIFHALSMWAGYKF